MKKAFTLFATLLLLVVFSFLIINIFEVKSLSSSNIVNKYQYIQGKNHLLFLEEYLRNSSLDGVNKIEIEDNKFKIQAYVKDKTSNFFIQMQVKAKDFDISLVKNIEINK